MKLVVAKNAPYNLGGAEHSLYSLLKDNAENCTVVYAENKKLGKAMEFDYSDRGALLSPIKGYVSFNRFFYYEYFFNRKKLINQLNDLLRENPSIDEIICQNRWSPLVVEVAKAHNIKSKVFLRDEFLIDPAPNYHKGLKRVLKFFYVLAEFPAIYLYKKQSFKALRNATNVVANSNFMSEFLYKRVGVHSSVMLPKIDAEELVKTYSVFNKKPPVKCIMLIGDNHLKGLESFWALSKKFPDQSFMVVGKGYKSIIKNNNVIYHPWFSSTAEALSHCSLLIVPSVWREGYGRVAKEARILNVPVIVRRIGGLPEAISFDDAAIFDTDLDMYELVKNYIES